MALNLSQHTTGNAAVIELLDQHVMHTYGRLPFALVKGKGAKVWDADGNEYLDGLAGLAVNSLGHCHPKVVEAIKAQAEKLLHVSNLYYIEPQAQLAKLLTHNSCCDRVFFCNSGAEANEAAIKLARKHGKKVHGPERSVIITALNSFHGRTLAAITATGQPKYQEGFEPLPPGFRYVPLNDIQALEQAVAPGDVTAIMLEPIQGEAGVYPCTTEYLQQVRAICDEKGILLIFDEVQTGLGRTGRLFAYEHYGVEPDIMTLAKALGGGVPIGAMLAKQHVAETFVPGNHASTFGGNPLACAAGLAAVTTLLEDGLVQQAAAKGEYLLARTGKLAETYPLIKEVRGKGLMVGVEFAEPVPDLMDHFLKHRILVNIIGGKILRLLPPLVITDDELDQIVGVLEEYLAARVD